MNETLTYSVAEVGKVLRISRSRAYDLVKEGVIPSITLGRRILVPKKALNKMLEDLINYRSERDQSPPTSGAHTPDHL